MRRALGVAGAILCLAAFPLPASEQDEIRAANRELLSLLQTKKHGRRSAAGERVAADRAARLSRFFAEDPRAARELLLPASAVSHLISRGAVSAAQIEQPWAWTGVPEISVADDLRNRRARTRFALTDRGTRIVAWQDGATLPGRCGDTIRLAGWRIGAHALATAATRIKQAQDDVCSTTGPQKIAVIVAGLRGKPAPDKEKVRRLVFGPGAQSLVGFVDENSYGRTSMTGDVFGPYQLSDKYGCGIEEMIHIRDDATAAARTDIRYGDYTRILVVHPARDCMDAIGLSTLGCTDTQLPNGVTVHASMAQVDYIGDADTAQTMAHELGHSFGVGHARSLTFPAEALGADRTFATAEEYGDLYSIMGNGTYSHLNAAHKRELGWLGDGEVATLEGEWDLLPVSSQTPGLKGIRIPRGLGDDYVWIEWRDRTGAYDGAVPEWFNDMFAGIAVRLQSQSDPLRTDLLDMHPRSLDESRFDLGPKRPETWFSDTTVWRDPYTDLSLRIVERRPGLIRVAVSRDRLCADVRGLAAAIDVPPPGLEASGSVSADAGCEWLARANNHWLDLTPAGTTAGPAEVRAAIGANPSKLRRSGSFTVARRTTTLVQSGEAAAPVVSAFGITDGGLPRNDLTPVGLVIEDPNGVEDIREAEIVAGTSADDPQACHVRYSPSEERTWGRGSAGGWLEVEQSLRLEQCYAGRAWSMPLSDTELYVVFDVQFTPATPARVNLYSLVRDGSSETAWAKHAETGVKSCAAFPIPFRATGPAGGGTTSVTVWTGDSCSWKATSNAGWIYIPSATGTGVGVLTLEIAANDSGEPRTGTVSIGEQSVTVTQGMPGDDVAVTVQEVRVSAAAGIGSVPVDTLDWDYPASSGASWLRVVNVWPWGVDYEFDANAGTAERRATLRIGRREVVIRQEGTADPEAPRIPYGGVVNAASNLPFACPGSWISIYGERLAPATRVWSGADFDGDRMPTSLDGVSVIVNNRPAYVHFISPGQINVLVPALEGFSDVFVEVNNNGRRSVINNVGRMRSTPELFRLPAPADRFVAATLQDGTHVAPADVFPGLATRPARPGEYVSLYLTGMGATNPAWPEGRLVPAPLPLASEVSVYAGDTKLPVSWAGLIGAGLYQVNIRIPADLTAGNYPLTVITDDGISFHENAALATAP